MAIQIIVDSTAGLPKGWCEENNIWVIPLGLILNGESYEETYIEDAVQGVSLDGAGTSQAQMHGFVKAFERVKLAGDQALCLTIASTLSGTYSAACIAAKMVGEEGIFVVDTKTTAGAMRIMVENAQWRRKEGWDMQAMQKAALWEADHTHGIFTTGDIKALQRSGRVGAAAAMLGGMMKIQPVIELVDGTLHVRAKVRGVERAMERLVAFIDEKWEGRMAVAYATDDAQAQSLQALVKQHTSALKSEIMQAGGVIACHLGKSALGLLVVETYQGA